LRSVNKTSKRGLDQPKTFLIRKLTQDKGNNNGVQATVFCNQKLLNWTHRQKKDHFPALPSKVLKTLYKLSIAVGEAQTKANVKFLGYLVAHQLSGQPRRSLIIWSQMRTNTG
jgi:hypothetical protein